MESKPLMWTLAPAQICLPNTPLVQDGENSDLVWLFAIATCTHIPPKECFVDMAGKKDVEQLSLYDGVANQPSGESKPRDNINTSTLLQVTSNHTSQWRNYDTYI